MCSKGAKPNIKDKPICPKSGQKTKADKSKASAESSATSTSHKKSPSDDKTKKLSADGDEEERCGKPDEIITFKSIGSDPRFQQTNQTLRCYVSYSDFHQCEYILGKGNPACQWFKKVYTAMCPLAWIEDWDQYVEEGRMPWYRKEKFPEAPYGKR